MKNLKKMTTMLMTITMVLALASCGNNGTQLKSTAKVAKTDTKIASTYNTEGKTKGIKGEVEVHKDFDTSSTEDNTATTNDTDVTDNTQVKSKSPNKGI